MIDNLRLKVLDPALKITDFKWNGDINILKPENAKGYVNYISGHSYSTDMSFSIRYTQQELKDMRNKQRLLRDVLKYILTNTIFFFWPIAIPIGIISYYSQKKDIGKFKEENLEYFI